MPSGKLILKLKEGGATSLPCLTYLHKPFFENLGLFVTSADPSKSQEEVLLQWWDVRLCERLHHRG